MVLNVDFDTIFLWILVGLVAGFFASHIALGHGLGIVGDVVVGIIGAFLGGFLSGLLHWSVTIVGHPVISAMIMAFLGAVILLVIVRILGMGRGGFRRRSWS